MSLVVGQNSWVTVDEADSYLTERIGSEAWFDLSTSSSPGGVGKESLIISAYFWLFGSPELSLSNSLTDILIKNAQIESVLFLLEHYTELNERRAAMFTGVKDFKMSKRSESLDVSQLRIPSHIIGMLSAYQISNCVVELKGEYDV